MQTPLKTPYLKEKTQYYPSLGNDKFINNSKLKTLTYHNPLITPKRISTIKLFYIDEDYSQLQSSTGGQHNIGLY